MTELRDLDESVAKSKLDREAVIRRFGFVPHSVLRLKRGARSSELYNYAAEHAQSVRGAESEARIDAFTTDAGKDKARQRQERGLFGGVREYAEQRQRTTISVMAAELVEFVCRYYARTGDRYLDPFAGHGVRMQVAWSLGMHYVGTDCCAEYVRYMRAVIDRIDDHTTELIVHEADARDPSMIEDGTGDICFTSPPYWDVEYYGPEQAQLGRDGVTYAEFLDGMRDVAIAWLPKFRAGAYVVLNVNDIRRDRQFIPYHSDLLRVFTDVGYLPHDVWIVEGLVAGLPKAFAVNFNMKRIAPKTHEYLLVFTVPERSE